MNGWVKLHRSDEAAELLRRHPNAFLLLVQIALRARWKECPIAKLGVGEAFVGDWKHAGLASESAYRASKERLTACGLATFRATNKGTIATLVNTTIFEVCNSGNDDQNNTQTTDQPRTNDEPTTTNKKDRRKDGKNNPYPSDDGGKKSSSDNSPQMIRIGKILNRRDSTRWSSDESKAFKQIDLSDEEVALVESFYAFTERQNDPLFRRTSLLTLLRHWPGEVDKARAWATKYGIKPKRVQTELKGVIR